MIRILLITIISLVTLSCSNLSHDNVKYVNVPVYYCPKPDIPERPKLELLDLNNSSSDSQVILAYGKSVDSLLLYSNRLLKELKSYDKLSNDK